MAQQHLLALMVALVTVFLTSCATSSSSSSYAVPRPRIEAPPQPNESLRLIIYRPQTLVGMLGKPVVVVNGQKMIAILSESMLEPGSVFIVDAPPDLTQVGWIQSRSNEINPDPLVFKELRGATRYLRWTLKPTYGYLVQVDENEARQELDPLKYTGYKNLINAK